MATLKLNWWNESADIETDPDSGAMIRMVTNAPAVTHDIYCEQPYCGADGNRLAMVRFADPEPTEPRDLLIYDIGKYQVARALRDVVAVATAAWSGVLFVTLGADKGKRLIRVDLNTLEFEDLFAWADLPGAGPSSISGDQRFGVTCKQIAERMFGIFTVDLRTGKTDLVHESPDIGNPHLQWRLRTGSRILIQENRGGVVDMKTGQWIKVHDERGVGLYSIKADGSDRRDFPVGPPHTPRTTGHECWIGDTDRVLVTTYEPATIDGRTGSVLEVDHARPKARVVFDSPHVWNHISASRCGGYFVTDHYCPPWIKGLPGVPILIGSIKTGKTRVLCHARTTGGGSQYTHAHPYMTSENKHVVFNSDRAGLAQVYIASIPDGFLASLD